MPLHVQTNPIDVGRDARGNDRLTAGTLPVVAVQPDQIWQIDVVGALQRNKRIALAPTVRCVGTVRSQPELLPAELIVRQLGVRSEQLAVPVVYHVLVPRRQRLTVEVYLLAVVRGAVQVAPQAGRNCIFVDAGKKGMEKTKQNVKKEFEFA